MPLAAVNAAAAGEEVSAAAFVSSGEEGEGKTKSQIVNETSAGASERCRRKESSRSERTLGLKLLFVRGKMTALASLDPWLALRSFLSSKLYLPSIALYSSLWPEWGPRPHPFFNRFARGKANGDNFVE